MQRIVAGVAFAAACLGSCLGEGTTSAAPTREETTVSFYRVPLMCRAARGLGCGSAAKPVLLALEQRPEVAEAWLNQTGEILAVVWSTAQASVSRPNLIAQVAKDAGISMTLLTAAERDATITGFRAGTGWHRGAEVDRLSAQEASVIATRLMRRAAATTPTLRDKQAIVSAALTEAIRHLLVTACASPAACRDAVLAAIRPHLDERELASMDAAVARGFAPIDNES